MKKALTAIMCCMVACLLCGCWNYKEVKDFTIVMGIGIDKGQTEKYEVCVEIASMKAEGESVRDASKPKIIKAQGSTVLSAIRSITATTGGTLCFDNCKIIVIGSDVCADGISDITEYFVKTTYFQKNIDIAAAYQTTAKAVFSVPPTNEEVVSTELANSIRASTLSSSIAMNVTPYQLYNEFKKSQGSVITSLKIKNDKETPVVIAGGYACFNKLKLCGYLDLNEALFFNFADNKVAKGQLSLNINGKINGFEIINCKTKIKNKNMMKITADVSAYEADNAITSKQLNEYISKNVSAVTKKMLNEYNCNAFSFKKDVSVSADVNIRDRRLAG